MEPKQGKPVGSFGWRKRCLYATMVVLFFTTTINVTLVTWLIKVIHFHTNGMSYLQMVGGGVQFTGEAYVHDQLVSSGLLTRLGEVMSIQSSRNITFRTTGYAGLLGSNIYLGEGRLEVNTPVLKISDTRGKTLFSVDKDIISLTSNSLSVSGEGGAVFQDSLQTPIVSSRIGYDLELESVKKEVHAVTPAGVSFESRAGDFLASSHRDISLVTIDGSIKLESKNIVMPALRVPRSPLVMSKHHHQADRIYQLCVCANGEMYLGDPDSICENELTSEMCG